MSEKVGHTSTLRSYGLTAQTPQVSLKRKTIKEFDPSWRVRGYFFTIWEKDNTDFEEVEKRFFNQDYDFIKYQIEKSKKGQLHIQGMLYNHNAIKALTLKNRFPHAHIERIKHLPSCIAYCGKEHTRVRGPYECGDEPHQGRNGDLVDAVKSYKEDPAEFYDLYSHFLVKYPQGFAALKASYYTHRTHAPRFEYVDLKRNTSDLSTFLDGLGQNYFIYFEKNGWNGYVQQHIIVFADKPDLDMDWLCSKAHINVKVNHSHIPLNSGSIYVICWHNK